MITGAIAVVFIIAMVVCAKNGEWGSFAVGAVIVVLLLAIGSASREEDRAYLNFMHYWDTGKLPQRRNRKRVRPERAGHVSRRERKEAAEKRKRYMEEERARKSDPSYVNGIKTVGNLLQTQNTTQRCPMCNSEADEFNRVQYSSGSIYVNYRCRLCGRTWPVKIR